jgi:hypothetical protein
MPVSRDNNLLGTSYQRSGTSRMRVENCLVRSNKTILHTISYALPAVQYAQVQTPCRRHSSALHRRRGGWCRGRGARTCHATVTSESLCRTFAGCRTVEHHGLLHSPIAGHQNGFLGRYASPDDLTKIHDRVSIGAMRPSRPTHWQEYHPSDLSLEGDLMAMTYGHPADDLHDMRNCRAVRPAGV